MKKFLCIIMLCVLALSAVGCSEEENTSDTVIKILNPMEYSMYLNVFQNDQGDSYANKSYTKDGIFAVIHDSYNDTLRYYVWGYSDDSLCCDWQWEFTPKTTEGLPPIGSRVKVTGILVENEDALDGYWLANASVETSVKFEGAVGDYDTTTMSPTLTRVQLINMMNFAPEYDGETLKIYGRVMSGNKLQHPYYDNAWVLTLDYGEALPAIGTWVTVSGKFSGSSPSDSKLIVESVKTGS